MTVIYIKRNFFVYINIMDQTDKSKAERQKRYYYANRAIIREKQRQAYIKRVGHEPYQGERQPGRPVGSVGSYKDRWIQLGAEQTAKDNELTQ
jgi:hypothetical protein